jgi:hypothetical protein
MTFVRKRSATVKWPVTVNVPADGGNFTEATFNAHFRNIGRADFNKLAAQGDDALIEAVLVGWDDMSDEDGKEILFSAATLKEQLDDYQWVQGTIAAYLEMLNGAKRKN